MQKRQKTACIFFLTKILSATTEMQGMEMWHNTGPRNHLSCNTSKLARCASSAYDGPWSCQLVWCNIFGQSTLPSKESPKRRTDLTADPKWKFELRRPRLLYAAFFQCTSATSVSDLNACCVKKHFRKGYSHRVLSMPMS